MQQWEWEWESGWDWAKRDKLAREGELAAGFHRLLDANQDAPLISNRIDSLWGHWAVHKV